MLRPYVRERHKEKKNAGLIVEALYVFPIPTTGRVHNNHNQ